MKKYIFLIAIILFSTTSIAANKASNSMDELSAVSIQSVLQAQKGKRVTLKMASGNEITGKLSKISGHVVYITGLSGMEFYDAAVSVSTIEAVIVRSK